MSLIYRFGLLQFLCCDVRLLLRSRDRVFGQSRSRGTAFRTALWQEHRVSSLRTDEGLEVDKYGKFCSQIAWMILVEQPQLTAHLLLSNQGISSGISIKQVLPRDHPGRIGRRGATSPCPSPHQPHGVLLKQAAETQGWSKLGWREALPRDQGPAKPCKERSAA